MVALIVTTIKAKSREDAVDKLKSMDIKQVMKKSEICNIDLQSGLDYTSVSESDFN